jgi:hypothetical protein
MAQMKTRKNLLIICEGESTEPNYFNDLRDEIIVKDIDYSITILPKPPLQKKAEDSVEEIIARNGGRRRALKNVPVEESYIVEKQYRAQPTRYVREAQLGLIDGTYDEAWAVYDYDGHPAHEEAYNLAQEITNHPRIHLGFSSLSFEAWILWHFEKNVNAFQKTQCRTGRELHDCGQATHKDDCTGSICLTGYLKTQAYISPERDVKTIRFKELEGKVYDALTNSYLTRQKLHQVHGLRPAYEFNPYTTVDRLVFKLMNLPINYQWIELFEDLSIPYLTVSVKDMYPIMELEILNISEGTLIIHPDAIILLTVKGDATELLTRCVLSPQETRTFTVNLNYSAENPSVYIAFKVAELTYKIIELPIPL